jgi:hypothetical protein
MLQKFVQNVSPVSNVCCKRFDLDVAYVSHMKASRPRELVSAIDDNVLLP